MNRNSRSDNYSVFHLSDFLNFRRVSSFLLNSHQLTSLGLQGLVVLYFLLFSKFQFCKAYVAFPGVCVFSCFKKEF